MSRTIQGEVVSNKADKTIVVAVKRRKAHPIYKKLYTSTRRFMVHDEKNEANIGDLVFISECRPVSKHKHWKLEKIVEKAHVKHQEAEPELEEEETK
ncbi:30S ribosomal protein S17 [Candidatus Saccharibacteria bacterium]|jgi:small subunit ribosomal protein S17|nr:30S ribosomal protein S17 [Candidatus Saccharibacteria bacterium]HPW47901.1 30S ribosomal protein S17 [Candidatus Saccharibacteria bacterium]